MPMQTLEALLPETEIFAGLDPRYLELIAGCAKNVRLEAREQIFRQGEQADTFFLVREGEVAMDMWVPGRGRVQVDTIGPGEVIGWSWLIPPYTWKLDAHATVPTRALAFDGACLRHKCAEDRDLGYELLLRFSSRLVEVLEATRLRLLDVYGRAD